jgi:solute carrier family 25 (mitochondrial iron transporter), member 28/37
MNEEDDYENLPNSSVAMNMLAGALAGITEHTVTYPLDVLKTRMQLLSGNQIYSNISQSITRMYTTEGLASLWRGLNSVILGSGYRLNNVALPMHYIMDHTRHSKKPLQV